MFGIQPIHIVIIILVALLIFGPKKLPEMGRNIGKAISEFRNGTREMTNSIRQEINQPVPPSTPNSISPENSILPTPLQSASVPPPSLTPVPSAPVPTPSQVAPSAGKFCIHCGAPNPPEARFCSSCGTQLPTPLA